jgi:hypothetical protein
MPSTERRITFASVLRIIGYNWPRYTAVGAGIVVGVMLALLAAEYL